MLTNKFNQDPLMELYHSTSMDKLSSNFKKICENYFIETFALAVLLKKEKKDKDRSKLFSTFDYFPPEWISQYNANQYYLNDPVFLRAQNITTPYYWHADKFETLNSIQKKILSEAMDFGIKRGTIIPLLPNGKFSGLLSLIDTSIHHPEVIYTLANASHIYLTQKEHFELRNKFALLTEREIKVLSLKAEGYSIKSISSELFISETTTLFHLKNIKRKLGFISTEQVVFKYLNYISS